MPASSSLARFIPVGCLRVEGIDHSGPDHPAGESVPVGKWLDFSHPSYPSAEGEGPTRAPALGVHGHRVLRRNAKLKSFRPLFDAGWVQFQACFDIKRQACILRVHVLPDDVDRILTPREDSKLLSLRSKLIRLLDFSPFTWDGDFEATPRGSPETTDRVTALGREEGSSLLRMFNEIPPPRPEPRRVRDLESRDAMEDLLSCQVYGIKSQLYPYQGRTAAYMVQREFNPGKVIDPRLHQARDQSGNVYYYDVLGDVILKEPRYYDGVSGGILAEEMGAGKTLICLAVIAATKGRSVQVPDLYRDFAPRRRKRIASLLDMAAASATQKSVPWRHYFEFRKVELEEDHDVCIKALESHPGFYYMPIRPPPRRTRATSIRRKNIETVMDAEKETFKIYLSGASIVVVPPNLLQQWKEEIRKHTSGLKVLILDSKRNMPEPKEIVLYDIILFSLSIFEQLATQGYRCSISGALRTKLSNIHFRRIIVDEGHRLGNSRMSDKSRLLAVADSLICDARWVVTGTPSDGLYGVEDLDIESGVDDTVSTGDMKAITRANTRHKASDDQEAADLAKLGNMASVFLRARPWGNDSHDGLDRPADWRVYVMQPRHSKRGRGDESVLRGALQALIIRHPVSEVKQLLPCIEEKVVVLDGSYQDKLALNIFSAMIIANSVQSQRTDQDYFFHPRQRTSLNELVKNLKQSSFFGGSFFSHEDILEAISHAEKFLESKKVPVSEADEKLLRSATEFMHMVLGNPIRAASSVYHELPLTLRSFPGPHGKEWALDDREHEDSVLLCASLVAKLQKLIQPRLDAPYSLMTLLNGRIGEAGKEAKKEYMAARKKQETRAESSPQKANADGDDKTNSNLTMTGQDDNADMLKTKYRAVDEFADLPATNPETGVPGPLQHTRIVATASAKLSYLIDRIVECQKDDQILVFYENNNAAFYLASVLDILQIKHLIYAHGLSVARRAQYVTTFNTTPTFRVLLMDISLAAFGLDMRAASRIFFISPVLNPQVEAQAVARARRISQEKPVKVETLVLRGSLEEVVVERRRLMTREEHRSCKSILDVGPIREWILNSKILPMGDGASEKKCSDSRLESQMAPLKTPQYVFCRDFGREVHPDQDLVMQEASPETGKGGQSRTRLSVRPHRLIRPKGKPGDEDINEGNDLPGRKRPRSPLPSASTPGNHSPKRVAKVRFAGDDAEDGGQLRATGDEGGTGDRPPRRVRFA